ncbi:MAG: sporulation protein [Flavobacteriaceae bacterium]|nr:sporulation protein [Flavobacteriaceae bacterium]|tara:strand:+ start:2820 stop:3752 length:933 start_codon:yes stop_codon:yes gene_type:complete
MQLTKHISYLLYRYDCVTVPGFGAFLGTPASAELDTDNETIYPPTKQISFNAQLQSNDGLLANAIAVEQQTSYEQAVRLVHKEVVRWKSMLHDGKTVELDRIGKLQFNAEKNVVFVPTKNYNHFAESFGLHPVQAQKIDRTKVLKSTPKIIDFNNDRSQNQTDSQGTNNNPLRHIAAAAAAAVIGYAGFVAYDDYTQDQQLAQEMELRQEAKEEVQQAIFDLGELPKLSIQTIPQEAYHIIGGAFAVESNADRYLKQLQQKGFVGAQKLAPNSYGLHMVALGSRVDRSEAIDFLRQVQRTEITDAWMLKR